MTEASINQLVSEAQARVQLLAQAGRWTEVARITDALTQAAPSSPQAWLMRSHAYAKLGRFSIACDAAQEAYRLQAPTPDERVYVARLAIKAQEFQRADQVLTQAEEVAPDHASVLAARALYLTYLGDKKNAELYCRKSIEADPSKIDAWPQLSMLMNGALTRNDEAMLQSLIRRLDPLESAHINARYLLAHSLDARGEIDSAFSQYAQANMLAFRQNTNDGFVFDRARSEAWVRHIMTVFGGASARIAGCDHGDGVRPLFIVGAPRSGSTLVESVIAAHSNVAAGGEAEMIPQMFNAWLKQTSRAPRSTLDPREREQFAAAYAKGAGAASGARFITDKNLLNIEAVGFIAELFPSAKIIHIRRDPLETGFGVFRQNFMRFWTWTTRLDDIGVRIGQIARLAHHWQTHYPERVLTVQYETFADDFPNQARRLLEFCGLDFEDQCLEFHKADGFVSTASTAQVREPMKKRSGKARRYAAHLAPLRAELEKAHVNLETGAYSAGDWPQ